MSRTSLPEFSRFLLNLYRHAQEVQVHEFQDAVLQAVKPLLHFDASVWGTGTMTAQGIEIHSLHRHNFPDEMFSAFAKVRHQDTAAMRMASHPRLTIGFSALEEFSGDDQADIRQFALDHSKYHCFITADNNPLTRFAEWVSLFRSDPQRRCKPEEIELLNALAPHLMQSLAINRLVHLDRLVGQDARASWAVAIADARGVLYHADPRFKELMTLEWPLEGGRVAASLLEAMQGGEARILGERVAGAAAVSRPASVTPR
jgi:hypothetical protein